MRFSRDAIELLQSYEWRGNVRELENVIRAAVNASFDAAVYSADLLPLLEARRDFSYSCRECLSAENTVMKADVNPRPSEARALDERVREFKLETVKATLVHFNGNVTRSANALGISRASLYKWIKELPPVGKPNPVPGTKVGS